jgi:predicted nucleotidyltransferase
MAPTIDELKQKIIPVLKKHRIKRAGLFGSSVTGKMKRTSDVDILVDVSNDISLYDFVQIKLELEDALGRPVDLVEYGMIKPLLRDRIMAQQVQIL